MMFEFMITQMTKTRRNALKKLSAFGLWKLNVLFGKGRIKFRIFFLKRCKCLSF